MCPKSILILRKSPKPPTTGNLPLQGSEKRPRQTRFQSKGGSLQGFRDQDSESIDPASWCFVLQGRKGQTAAAHWPQGFERSMFGGPPIQ